MPSGFSSIIQLKEELAGTTFIVQAGLVRCLKIVHFAPKSIATIFIFKKVFFMLKCLLAAEVTFCLFQVKILEHVTSAVSSFPFNPGAFFPEGKKQLP